MPAISKSASICVHLWFHVFLRLKRAGQRAVPEVKPALVMSCSDSLPELSRAQATLQFQECLKAIEAQAETRGISKAIYEQPAFFR